MSRRDRARWRRLVVLSALSAALAAPHASATDTQGAAVLTRLGWKVSAGAAPGYVDSRTCRPCHLALWESYQDVGMARSLFRPAPERNLEDFAHATFEHETSGERYTMSWRDGKLWFRRTQLAEDGTPLFPLELPVDRILGSGHHARTYLYRSGGELYQLPLAWYTAEGRWGMAPGYDRADHPGVLRHVRRECMVCHDAYPDVAAGSDRYPAPPNYPDDLPEGTGCQRCHGPGAAHAALALDPDAGREAIRASIVNPARLAPARRDDVCNQCHLQPSVALAGVRRFGQGDYAYRPGTPLAAHLVQVEATQEDGESDTPGGRFEINHHAYRLRRSRCATASAGKLACITCHDPHRRLGEAEKADHFRRACLTCHQAESCSRHHAADAAAAAALAYSPADAADDCVSCHMPKRRTADVVHVVVTDHLIQKRPPDGLLAPRPERDPVLTGARLLEPEAAGSPAEAEIYRVTAVVRTAPSAVAVDRLAALLALQPEAAPEPRLDLALAQLQLRRSGEAEKTLRALRGPDSANAANVEDWLALAQLGGGNLEGAIATLREVVAKPEARAESHYNLGRLLLAQRRYVEARVELLRATVLRPNLAAAWLRLGDCERGLDNQQGALADYRQALALDPRLTDGYLTLAETLLAGGDRAAATRLLRHGSEHAADPGRVRERLRELDAAPVHP